MQSILNALFGTLHNTDSKFTPYPSNSIKIDHPRLCCCNTVKITAVEIVLAVDGRHNVFFLNTL
jgi:hypothetical protein